MRLVACCSARSRLALVPLSAEAQTESSPLPYPYPYPNPNPNQLNTIMTKSRRSASDDIVDFEAFVKQTPKTLRTSLIRLAKENGNDLGFLA